MSPYRDWLKGGIDFCFRSNSRIGSAFILSASSFCCATDLSVPPWARRAEELARRMNRSKIGTGQNHDWAYYSLHPVPMGLPGRRSYAGYGEKHFALAERG